MARYNNYTANDLLRCLNVLKEHKKLTAKEWAEKMGINDAYLFGYLRRKTMTYFEQYIKVEGKSRGTHYIYINSIKKKDPTTKNIGIKKTTKDTNVGNTVIGTWKELKTLIENSGCNFKGDCNLKELRPLYCAFCSHQVRFPIPETVRSNRTISKPESQLNHLKIKEVS